MGDDTPEPKDILAVTRDLIDETTMIQEEARAAKARSRELHDACMADIFAAHQQLAVALNRASKSSLNNAPPRR